MYQSKRTIPNPAALTYMPCETLEESSERPYAADFTLLMSEKNPQCPSPASFSVSVEDHCHHSVG